MQFGVQLYSLRELIGQKGLKEALRLVSAAGFSGVEFAGFYGYGAEQLQELFRALPSESNIRARGSTGDGGGDPDFEKTRRRLRDHSVYSFQYRNVVRGRIAGMQKFRSAVAGKRHDTRISQPCARV